MCGIVGVGAKQSQMNSVLVKFFENMLYHDIVRGPHATGVYRGMPENSGVAFYKDAVPSFDYLVSDNWNILKGDSVTEYQVKQKKEKGEDIPLPLSNFYVGHNRYATMGAATDPKGAHPFNVGNVTLVHNGTLTGKWRLPDANNYKVDSHNIAHSIDKVGFEETLSKLQGAYTLVWHDGRDNTLNFFRNSERPLWMVELTSGAWIWCSEEEMFNWLNSRRKVEFTIKRAFELPVGDHMIFDVSNDEFKLKEVVKRELPSFAVSRSYYSGNNWGGPSWANRQQTGFVPSKKDVSATSASADNKEAAALASNLVDRTNNVIKAHGLEKLTHGSIVPFTPYEWRPYYDGSKNGRIRGYYLEGQDYAEVEAHGFSEVDYEQVVNIEIYGKIKTAYPEVNILKDAEDKDNTSAVMVVEEVSFTEEELLKAKEASVKK